MGTEEPRNSTAKRTKYGTASEIREEREREGRGKGKRSAKTDGELSANCIYHCYFKDAPGIVPFRLA